MICKDVQNRCVGVRSKDFRYVPASERTQMMTVLLHFINVCIANNKGKHYKQTGKRCIIM